jgi:Tol biopolymer transport system component
MTREAGGALLVAELSGADVRAIGGEATNPAWSPDGGLIAYVDEGRIAVVPPAGGSRRLVTRRRFVARFPAWSRDGRQLAYLDGASAWTVSRPTWKPRRLTGNLFTVELDEPPLAWAPDGRWLASLSDGTVRIVPSRGGRARVLPSWPRRRATGPPHWLGRDRLAFTAAVRGNDRELYLSCGSPRALTQNRVGDMHGVASPDGRRIAFVRGRAGVYALYTMRADGSSVRRLTRPTLQTESPTWSRDARRIAYTTGRGELFVVAAGGGRARHLGQGLGPSWSPDGSWIAVELETEIYLISPDGRKRRRLTRHALLDRAPTWSPDGTRIAFVSNRPPEGLGIFVMRERHGRAQAHRRWAEPRVVAGRGHDCLRHLRRRLDRSGRRRRAHPGDDYEGACRAPRLAGTSLLATPRALRAAGCPRRGRPRRRGRPSRPPRRATPPASPSSSPRARAGSGAARRGRPQRRGP